MNNFVIQFAVFTAAFFLIACSLDCVQGQRIYTEKEKEALVKFRKLMGDELYRDYMKSDPYLIRWLRARNFKLEDAKQMLQAALKWRKENKMDGILEEKILEFIKPPIYTDGVDFEGSVVTTFIPAKIDIRRYAVGGKMKEIVRYWDQLMEKAEHSILALLGVIGNSSASENARVDQGTFLMDVNGYSLRQHACLNCLAVYLQWFIHMENYYPGYAKHFILVNVPRIAIPMIELVKPAMSPATRKVLQVYGTNKNEWLPVIRKLVPLDQVRSNLGGTKPQ